MRSKGSKGRPPTRQAALMAGFYIEVRNKGSKDKGVKIRCANKEAMIATAKNYVKNKEVILLGEHKNDKWVSDPINFNNLQAKA